MGSIYEKTRGRKYRVIVPFMYSKTDTGTKLLISELLLNERSKHNELVPKLLFSGADLLIPTCSKVIDFKREFIITHSQ
jgi:hypothetical protein